MFRTTSEDIGVAIACYPYTIAVIDRVVMAVLGTGCNEERVSWILLANREINNRFSFLVCLGLGICQYLLVVISVVCSYPRGSEIVLRL